MASGGERVYFICMPGIASLDGGTRPFSRRYTTTLP
jgi:glycerol dehydrogenase-like iron-containing ADH family enzyme